MELWPKPEKTQKMQLFKNFYSKGVVQICCTTDKANPEHDRVIVLFLE